MLRRKLRFTLSAAVSFGVLMLILLGNTPSIGTQYQVAPRIIASVHVDGHERFFTVYNNNATGLPQPLLIVLGQSGMSGQGMANLAEFHTQANLQNFVVAYPQAIDFWNDGRVMNGFLPSGAPLDDVQYIERMIDYLAGIYTIDLSQVYLVGYRDGGRMAYHLACQRPQRFKRVAVVGALMWEYIDRACQTATVSPLDMLIAVSSQSEDYPLEGGQYESIFDNSRAFMFYSLNQTVDRWLTRNHCQPEANQRIGTATINASCANGAIVASYVYLGGENVWLSPNRPNESGLNLTQLVTQFLVGDSDWMNQPIAASDHMPRNDVLYIPNSYDGSRAVPLVVMLHPSPLNGAEFAYISDMNRIAEREGFIALYPEALYRHWYYDRGYEFGAETENHDDTQYITTLVQLMRSQLNIIDVYLVGMSSGGFMTQRLICETQGMFQAAAVIGATAFPGLDEICHEKDSVPLLMIHGTDDSDVPWAGLPAPEMSPYDYMTYPVQDTLALWAAHNGCTTTFELEHLPASSPQTHVERYKFNGCNQELLFYAVVGGGHAWIGLPGRLPSHFSGNVNTDLHASELIWDFFTSS
ncbi:MAG: hypothetical protein Kow00117_01040 [Phototrophicales bacterium]